MSLSIKHGAVIPACCSQSSVLLLSDFDLLIYILHITISTINLILYVPTLKHVWACFHVRSPDLWGVNLNLQWFNKSRSVFQLEATHFSPRSLCHSFSPHVFGLWEQWGGWLRPSFIFMSSSCLPTIMSSFHFYLACHLFVCHLQISKMPCAKSSMSTEFHNVFIFSSAIFCSFFNCYFFPAHFLPLHSVCSSSSPSPFITLSLCNICLIPFKTVFLSSNKKSYGKLNKFFAFHLTYWNNKCKQKPSSQNPLIKSGPKENYSSNAT